MNVSFGNFSNAMYTQIFLIKNLWFNVALEMYTQFRCVWIFYLLLFSFCRSTLLYVKYVPQYHWQIYSYNIIFRNYARPILILWVHFKPRKNQYNFSEMEHCLQQQQKVNLYPTRVGIYTKWKMYYLSRKWNNHEINYILWKIQLKLCSMKKLQ